jgi:quinol monooxygenase YgiN
MTDETQDGVVSLIVTMTVKPEQEAAFLAMAGEMIAWVRANEEGTVLYTLNRNTDAEHTFTWVERYRDEAAFQSHGSSDQIAKARARLPEMLAQPPVRMLLRQIAP